MLLVRFYLRCYFYTVILGDLLGIAQGLVHYFATRAGQTLITALLLEITTKRQSSSDAACMGLEPGTSQCVNR